MKKIFLRLNTDISFKLFFITLPFGYFFLYGRYGLYHWDDGFILGLAWRVLNGEIPYKDFIYKSPPASIYLHSIFLYLLPEQLQFIFERLLHYILFALTSIFGVMSLDKYLPFRNLGINKYLFASIAFVFSVNSFAPIPFHTFDGIFLSALGLFLITRKNIFAGILITVVAALTKQSFYVVPFAVTALVYFLFGKKSFLSACVYLCLFILSFILLLFSTGTLQPFIEYTFGVVSTSDLLDLGFLRYIKISWVLPASSIFVFTVLYITLNKCKNIKLPYYWLVIIFFILSFFINILGFLNRELMSQTFYDFPHILFLATLGFILTELTRKGPVLKPFLYVLIMEIIISWASSLSWGLKTPIFFFCPILAGIFYILNNRLNFKHLQTFGMFLLVMGLLLFGTGYYQRPYLCPPRKTLTFNAEDIFEKLKYIKVHKAEYERLSELKNLHNKYGDNFKTLPSMPMSNYLTNTTSPIQLDWLLNVETAWKIDSVIQKLNNSNAYVFVLRLEAKNTHSGIWGSLVTKHVVNNWRKIEETKHFYVYKKAPENTKILNPAGFHH